MTLLDGTICQHHDGSWTVEGDCIARVGFSPSYQSCSIEAILSAAVKSWNKRNSKFVFTLEKVEQVHKKVAFFKIKRELKEAC